MTVVNATTVDWVTGGGSNHIFSGSSEARLKGWLRWNGTGETLHICAGHSNISLTLGDNTESIANLTAQLTACSPVEWSDLFPGRLSIDMLANDSLHTGLYPSHHHAKMELLHNKSQESAKVCFNNLVIKIINDVVYLNTIGRKNVLILNQLAYCE